MDPSKRFITLVLAAGVAVLLTAILIGEQMGSKVLVAAANSSGSAETIVTPLPSDGSSSSGPFGPDWKHSQTLAAAPDPGFPDPRVAPQPLPTPLPNTPKPSPTPRPHDLPIWDQTFTPSPSPSGGSPNPAEPVPSTTPTQNP